MQIYIAIIILQNDIIFKKDKFYKKYPDSSFVKFFNKFNIYKKMILLIIII